MADTSDIDFNFFSILWVEERTVFPDGALLSVLAFVVGDTHTPQFPQKSVPSPKIYELSRLPAIGYYGAESSRRPSVYLRMAN